MSGVKYLYLYEAKNGCAGAGCRDIMENCERNMYVQVILPIKYRGEITYIVPQDMWGDGQSHSVVGNSIGENGIGGCGITADGCIAAGSRVKVDFAGRIYTAVVEKVFFAERLPGCEAKSKADTVAAGGSAKGKEIVYKEILGVEEARPVSGHAIRFWYQVAEYYMCSVGEVYRAAYPNMVARQELVKSRKTPQAFFKSIGDEFGLPQLSGPQNGAFEEIKAKLAENRPVLLHGVTGSGKTEIYINLAAEQLQQGRNVLYMVPEIALSKQLQNRLKKVFGERLLVYHSKQTAAEKWRIHKIVSGQFKDEYLSGLENEKDSVAGNGVDGESVNDAVVVLGTRSSLFLPFENLGLVVVDEEHDSSYKQTEPAPRYQARDAAIMLANIHGAATLLGSATPSFESEYNCKIGRFAKVGLYEKYYGAQPPQIEIIDTIWARRSGQMKGSFSQKLINEMRKALQSGQQVLIFKNRRSYSPIVECTECGTIPKCPCCNVYMSYHKYNSTLRCHYCDYTVKFDGICTKCGLDTLKYKGAGTEKIEEELTSIFPEYSVARFDADIAESKRREEAVIRAFTQKETDILVGTQMISKGFDFENLGLVAVLDTDSILGIQDFRADERALQMFSQLMGRTGRRNRQGKILIQTNQKEHPVIQQLQGLQEVEKSVSPLLISLLEERREFNFAPYVRMVKITVRHSNREKLDKLCGKVSEALSGIPCKEFTGPFVPAIDKVRGEWLKCFYVKFLRDSKLSHNKQKLLDAVAALKTPNAIVLDVDPL